MICIDEPEKIQLSKNKGISKGIEFFVESRICKDHPDCYPEEKIRETLFKRTVSMGYVHNR